MQEPVIQKYFSVKDTAKYVGLSEDKVRDWIAYGLLPCSNVGSPDRPVYRIDRIDVEELMKKLKVVPVRTTGSIALPFSSHRKGG